MDPNLLRGVTLLGHACLRLGMHEEAARYLQEGLTLAMSQGGAPIEKVACIHALGHAPVRGTWCLPGSVAAVSPIVTMEIACCL